MGTWMSCAPTAWGSITPSHQHLLHVVVRSATQSQCQAGHLAQPWQRPRNSKQVGLGLSWYDITSRLWLSSTLFACKLAYFIIKRARYGLTYLHVCFISFLHGSCDFSHLFVASVSAAAIFAASVFGAIHFAECYNLLQGWLSHKDVQLAAYFPFFKEAGIDEIEVRLTHLWHIQWQCPMQAEL